MSPTGHIAVGFAARKYAPGIPLPVLLVATYAIDLIYFIFTAIRVETIEYSPWSHSLIMALVWSMVGLIITMIITRSVKNGAVIGLLVFSHYILDLIAWDNQLVTFDSGLRIGFGLYNKIGFSQTDLTNFNIGTVLATGVELALLAIGLTQYMRYRKRTIGNKALRS